VWKTARKRVDERQKRGFRSSASNLEDRMATQLKKGGSQGGLDERGRGIKEQQSKKGGKVFQQRKD